MAYRIPREPSTPRIAVWRKLERLGALRLGDGLVAVPADARTREQIDWIAGEVRQADGTASVWIATPADAAHERDLLGISRAARSTEYRAVLAEARAAATQPEAERIRTLRRLRGLLRRVDRRDFFGADDRDQAHAAVDALARPEAAAEPAATVPDPGGRPRGGPR